MRDRRPKDFLERLKEAEHSDKMLREVCEEELKNCGSDPEKLAGMVKCLGWISLDGEPQGKDEKTCMGHSAMCVIYEMIDEVCRYAKTLSPQNYHRFCELITASGWSGYFGIL